uniref:Dicer-like protein 1 n=1 Tax=Pseudo-nitzschia multistriata TaxID=183589 RepID=A0A448ZDB2_9STRA
MGDKDSNGTEVAIPVALNANADGDEDEDESVSRSGSTSIEDDGIFDDAEQDDSDDGNSINHTTATIIQFGADNEIRNGSCDRNGKDTAREQRKRRRRGAQRKWFYDRLCEFRRALKRRRRREQEIERQRDPQQFDDTEFISATGSFPSGTHGSHRLLHSHQSSRRDRPNERDENEQRQKQQQRQRQIVMTNKDEAVRSRPTENESETMNDVATNLDNLYGQFSDATNKALDTRKQKDRSTSTREDENQTKTGIQDDSNDLSSSFFKFDEQKLFQVPIFAPGIKESAFQKIYAAMEEPMKLLEDRGYDAYKEFIEDCDNSVEKNDSGGKRRTYRGRIFRNRKSARTNHVQIAKQKEESIRKSMEDALVNGDPREYQRLIFEVAKKRNTIVYLGTGAGKTLIALLLIREYWSGSLSSSSSRGKDETNQNAIQGEESPSKETNDSIENGTATVAHENKSESPKNGEVTHSKKEKQQTLFLVPSVALAIQQSLTLRANLPQLCIETACYATASSKRARASLERCEVIVATHGAIQDLFMHYGDSFSMDRLNLLVIDECHYAASGNHAYRHLMEKFYRPIQADRRPRVLGLTASPLLNVKENHSDGQLTAMLDSLESVLDSKMLSAAGLIAPHRKKQKEGSETTSLTPILHSTNNILHRVIDERSMDYYGTNQNRTIPSTDNLDLLPSRHREFKQLEHLYRDLGPLVVSIYSSVLKRELSRNIFENESTRRFDLAVGHLQRIEDFCNREIKVLPNMGRNDKLLALEELVETLIEEKGTKTIGLVFVERRATAIALQCYFVWRNEQIHDWSTQRGAKTWVFAKEARRNRCKSDDYFEMNSCRKRADQVVKDDDCDDNQFDDSSDDPFHQFQKRKEARKKTKIVDMDCKGELEDSATDHFNATNQFMDADSCSSDAWKDSPKQSLKNDFFETHGRVALKPVALVRNPIHIFNSLSIHQKKLKEAELADLNKIWVHRESNVRDVLSRLRSGHVNIMFATSVVEEGVDVQSCSLVVAFDGISSIKGYIQMKGRARKQDAKFYVFGDPYKKIRSTLELRVAQRMECRIEKVIEKRMGLYAPTMQALSSHHKNSDCAALLHKEFAAIQAGVYKVEDATVDLQSAKSLVYRYFLSVPLDPFVRYKKESLLQYMPFFESDSLVLPVHLPSEIRTVTLPSKYSNSTWREKQKLLCLMACVRLHHHGLLNERLLPLTRKDMQQRVLRIATQDLQQKDTVPLDLDGVYNNEKRQLVIYPVNEESSLLSNYRRKLNGKGHSLGLITMEPIREMLPFRTYHKEFGKVSISFGEPILEYCSSSEFEILQETFALLMNSRWSRKSRNVSYETRSQDEYEATILPYLVGIISSNGNLDWDFMTTLLDESKRSIENRTLAARSFSSTTLMSQPRIWSPTYSNGITYVVFGPTGKLCGAPVPYKMDGVKTYCDYFQKKYSIDFEKNSPLFRGHRLWSLPSGYIKKHEAHGGVSDSENVDYDMIDIPQQAFVEEPLANAHIVSLCLFLPQVLFNFEQEQKTEAFIKHCEVCIPTLGACFKQLEFSMVKLVMTSKSCNASENYDIYEWVGDAVLKLLQTDSILSSPKLKHFVKFLHEGDLSMLRSGMGTNNRLKQICTHLRLDEFIMMTPLSRGVWVPSPLQIYQTTNKRIAEPLGGRMKLLADVVEAILGIVYIEFGYHRSIKVGNELHVTLPWDENDRSVACGEIGDVDNNLLVDVIKKCTGHAKVFDRPKVVSEAFTHPSAIDASVPSYQRLEWIGDAVLCLCTREWLFRNFGDRLEVGDLVMLEGAIVSNETLGFISMKCGLQQYLNHRDLSLPKRIESYCWKLKDGCGFWGGDPPKPIADTVEAVLGAIHVSSDFKSGQTATLKLMSPIFSVIKKASDDGIERFGEVLRAIKHPKKSLQEISGQIFQVIVCSEHEFASFFEYEDEIVPTSTAAPLVPQILHKNEWRNPARGNGEHEGCYVSFISMLGYPLVAVADESITDARNRASSLMREAIQCNPTLQNRIKKYRSIVERNLTLAGKRQNEMTVARANGFHNE